MTQKRLTAALSALFLFLTLFASAQPRTPKAARWISDKGYWVVESNIHTPKQSTVFFYNNDGVLLYKEAVSGHRIHPERNSTRRRLAAVLEQSIALWEKNGATHENQQWLARRF